MSMVYYRKFQVDQVNVEQNCVMHASKSIISFINCNERVLKLWKF